MTIFKTEHTVRVVPGEDSEYRHWFGGDPIHEGARFRGAENLLHLVYCLNLSDPALTAVTKIPGVQWLPLYFGFKFDACQFGYLVQSDNRIEVFHDTQQFVDDFPYEKYPPVFPRTPVRMEPLGYEEKAERKHLTDAALPLLRDLRSELAGLDSWTAEALEAASERVRAANGDLGMGKLAQPVRVAVTGRAWSPGIFDVLEVVGRERSLARLERAIEHVESR